MKKQYIQPTTESVKVNLYGSVLEGYGDGTGRMSDVTDTGLAKEQDGFFETDGSFGDIWDDGGDSSNPYDLWDE